MSIPKKAAASRFVLCLLLLPAGYTLAHDPPHGRGCGRPLPLL
jgi:hypothetical protein